MNSDNVEIVLSEIKKLSQHLAAIERKIDKLQQDVESVKTKVNALSYK